MIPKSLDPEKSMKLRHLLIPITLLAGSCTTAGPFVTSISSDGQGNLVIEKSMVKFNAFMGTVSNESTTTHKVHFVAVDRAAQRAITERPNVQPSQDEAWTGDRD